MFQKPEIRIALKVLILAIVLFATAFLLIKGLYIYSIITVPVIVYVLSSIYKMLRKAQEEVREFVESIHYRDFSRTFNVRHAPAELQLLRQGFNEINSTFRVISKEKEVQYQYLQQILELVDTGIISYEATTGTMNWMNNAFKKMLNIPYLKNINALKRRDEALYEAVVQVKPGDTQVINITKDNRQLKVLIAATMFQTDNTTNKLIAFQNIHDALDENEALAWQKLLSVMTHEIMNSIAPIASLADTLKKNIAVTRAEIGDNTSEDLELGLETIKKRSEGLLKFAESYRNLNKITKPNRTPILIRDLFENILTLMQPTIEQKNIDLDVILKEPNLAADVDVNLIEQVLINLIVNAIEAVKDTPHSKITLSAYQDQNKLVLKVGDNGAGIPPQLLDKIFVPFFSTKKSGSGIGLSLCKQIMLLHKGSIQVQSIEGEGSVFKLQLPIGV